MLLSDTYVVFMDVKINAMIFPCMILKAEMTSHKDSGVELADLDLIDWILDDEPMFPEEELLPSSSDISNHFAAEPHVMPVSPDASVLNESEASKVLPSPIKLS